ncbi:hypothetical protein Peur_030804 [Populus x canadensis]
MLFYGLILTLAWLYSVGAEAAPSSSWEFVVYKGFCGCVLYSLCWIETRFISFSFIESLSMFTKVKLSYGKVALDMKEGNSSDMKKRSLSSAFQKEVGFSLAIVWSARSKPRDVPRHPSEDLGVLAPRVDDIA